MIFYLLIIIPILSTVTMLICLHGGYGLDFEDYFVSLGLGVVSCVATFVIILLTFAITEKTATTKYELENTQTIYNLSDNMNRQAYLVSGDIYKMYVDRDGGKSLLKVKSRNTVIYEDNKTQIETYVCKFQNKYVKFLLGENTMFEPVKYKIHIPENSIITEYNIDLK